MSSSRDVVPDRRVVPGLGATGVQVMGGDIDRPIFYPQPGAIHTVATAAAGRAWTITTDSVAALDLPIGSGFLFYVQNNGASTITLAGSGVVAAGAGTLTVATARVRIFALTRIGAASYQLDTLGTLTQ